MHAWDQSSPPSLSPHVPETYGLCRQCFAINTPASRMAQLLFRASANSKQFISDSKRMPENLDALKFSSTKHICEHCHPGTTSIGMPRSSDHTSPHASVNRFRRIRKSMSNTLCVKSI